MLAEITLLLVAGLGNLAWDVTGRRVSARTRRRERRERRGQGLPLPSADDHADDPFAVTVAPGAFVEVTRATVEELDRVVDHFDLVLLRAEAGESLVGDIVYIGGEGPRERGRALLETWLDDAAGLPADLLAHLRDLGLPDAVLSETLERERARSYWPNAATSRDLLAATATDFEAAVVLLVNFLRTLTAASGDPYR